MKITKVTYYDIVGGKPDYMGVLSRCSIVLEDYVIVHDIKVLSGKKGRYIIMPEKVSGFNSDRNNESRSSDDVFHPICRSFFSYMKDVILEGYLIYEREGLTVYKPV